MRDKSDIGSCPSSRLGAVSVLNRAPKEESEFLGSDCKPLRGCVTDRNFLLFPRPLWGRGEGEGVIIGEGVISEAEVGSSLEATVSRCAAA